MKKIVIIPVFCESHLIKYQIPNIIDTIDPDIIIYNEGMFPRGPEGKTDVTDKFIMEYTLDGYRGFDFNELKTIITDAQLKYPDKTIILNKINYPEYMTSAPECYYYACSNFKELGIDINIGDCIFPLEGDVFHHENSKQEIQGYIEQLQPDSGFKSTWIDFLETQYYCERVTLQPFLDKQEGRHRRVCIKYGTQEFYKNVLLNFMTQRYDMLHHTDLITYHYAWWRPKKYKQLRFSQLNRSEGYWDKFNNSLQEIKSAKNKLKHDLVLREDSDGLSRWASYINIQHPKHIHEHENFIKDDK